MNIYADLFLTFARVGVMTFGGGYAMLPILEREVCEDKGWATKEELMDYYAIGQCTPGVIAVNTATFIGKKLKGVGGACAATVGVVFPSIVIITIIAAFIHSFSHLEVVQHAFAGIRACVCVLILNAVIKLWKSAVVDVGSFMLYAVVLMCSLSLHISPVFFILAAGIFGIVFKCMGIGENW